MAQGFRVPLPRYRRQLLRNLTFRMGSARHARVRGVCMVGVEICHGSGMSDWSGFVCLTVGNNGSASVRTLRLYPQCFSTPCNNLISTDTALRRTVLAADANLPQLQFPQSHAHYSVWCVKLALVLTGASARLWREIGAASFNIAGCLSLAFTIIDNHIGDLGAKDRTHACTYMCEWLQHSNFQVAGCISACR